MKILMVLTSCISDGRMRKIKSSESFSLLSLLYNEIVPKNGSTIDILMISELNTNSVITYKQRCISKELFMKLMLRISPTNPA